MKIEEAFRVLGRTEKAKFISQNIDYANADARYLREKGYEVKEQEHPSNL